MCLIISKKETISLYAERYGVTKKAAKKILEDVGDFMCYMMECDVDFSFKGVLTLKKGSIAPKKYRDFKTGKILTSDPKTVVKLVAGRRLINACKKSLD